MSRAPRFVAPLVLLLLGLAFGCGGGGGGSGGGNVTGPVLDSIPASWAGIWSVNVVARICGTSEELLNTTVVDTLCPGAPTSSIAFDTLCAGATFRAVGNTTTYACTDNVSDGTCSGVMGVNVTTTIDPVAGTSLGTGRIVVNLEPNTAECPDVCLDVTLAGTRVGPAPAQCVTLTALLPKALRGRSLVSRVPR